MAKAYIQARKNGLQSCMDAIDKVREQARAKVEKAADKYGKDSDQYGEAMAEFLEVEPTVHRWKGLMTGRQHDLDLAAAAEASVAVQTAKTTTAARKAGKKAETSAEPTTETVDSEAEE